MPGRTRWEVVRRRRASEGRWLSLLRASLVGRYEEGRSQSDGNGVCVYPSSSGARVSTSSTSPTRLSWRRRQEGKSWIEKHKMKYDRGESPVLELSSLLQCFVDAADPFDLVARPGPPEAQWKVS